MPQLNSNCGSSALHEECALIYPVTATPREGHFACVGTTMGATIQLDDSFGYWFAGLVDGEGHFALRKRDKGRGYRAVFRLELRQDDHDVLAQIQTKLGVGNVYHYDYVKTGGSRPTACFAISSHTELNETLIPVLDIYPLRSKKRKEYKIWRTAVLLMKEHSQGVPYSERSLNQLSYMADYIRRLRCFDKTAFPIAVCSNQQLAFWQQQQENILICPSPSRDATYHIDNFEKGFGDWLAGFIDGEGHFGAHVRKNGQFAIAFIIGLRADDRMLLENIRRALGVGTVGIFQHKGFNPVARYVCYGRKTIIRKLIPLLDKHPLRSRKRWEYEKWREIILALNKNPNYHRWAVVKAAQELLALRTYNQPIDLVEEPAYKQIYQLELF